MRFIKHPRLFTRYGVFFYVSGQSLGPFFTRQLTPGNHDFIRIGLVNIHISDRTTMVRDFSRYRSGNLRFRLSPAIFPYLALPILSLSVSFTYLRPLPDDRQDVSLRVPRARIACRDACVVPGDNGPAGALVRSPSLPRYSRNFRAEALYQQTAGTLVFVLQEQVQFPKKLGTTKYTHIRNTYILYIASAREK